VTFLDMDLKDYPSDTNQNTIEKKMILIKESKSEIAKGVVSDNDAVSLLTKENLMELIGMQVS